MICNPLDFLPISSPINRVRTAALPRLETPTPSVPRCSQKETCRDGGFHRGCGLWMTQTQHTPHFPTLLSAKGADKLTTTFRDVLHASPQEGFIWRRCVSLEWHRSIGPSICLLFIYPRVIFLRASNVNRQGSQRGCATLTLECIPHSTDHSKKGPW